jgi:hypothetical protein
MSLHVPSADGAFTLLLMFMVFVLVILQLSRDECKCKCDTIQHRRAQREEKGEEQAG